MRNIKIEPEKDYQSDVMMTSEDDVIEDTYTVIPRIYLDDARHRSQEFERYIARQQKYPKECIPKNFKNFEKKNEKNWKIWNAIKEYNLYNAVYEMEFSAAQYFQTVTQIVQFIFYFTLYL